jgi:hypothetical protein
MISTVLGLYVGNSQARDWVDRNILKKVVEEEALNSIDLENDNARGVAFSSRIAVVSNNTLKIYDESAKETTTIDVNITTPIFYSNGDYLLVGDYGKSNIYLIQKDMLCWSKELDGNISQIFVNERGDSGVVLTGTSYKSIITMYNSQGNEQFKTYISTSLVTDISISNNGEQLNYIDVDTTGAIVISKVKTIDVAKARTDSENSLKYTYEFDANELLLKISTKNKKIVAFSTKALYSLQDGNKEKIFDITENVSFMEINLKNQFAFLEEMQDGEDAGKPVLKIIDLDNNQERDYIMEEMVKDIYSSSKIAAISTGNEVYLVKTNGTLLKRFITDSNIMDISIGKSVVGIIYKNRIEILKI